MTWKQRLSVGNAIIDSEHRNLMASAENINAMMKAGDTSAVLKELQQFEHWQCTHFENEEKIALAVNFDVSSNSLDHQNALKKFQCMKDELISCGNILPDHAIRHYSRFLSDWLVGHIVTEDMRMKPLLQTYPYNFMPHY